jgi:hypothetical protein
MLGETHSMKMWRLVIKSQKAKLCFVVNRQHKHMSFLFSLKLVDALSSGGL